MTHFAQASLCRRHASMPWSSSTFHLSVDKASALANPPLSSPGRRPASREIELKLAAPASELEKVQHALLALPNARLENNSDFVSTYFDTPTCAIHRRRMTLRVRRQGRQFVQTIKIDAASKPDLLE